MGIFLDGDVKYGGGDILVKKFSKKKIIKRGEEGIVGASVP